MTRKKTAAREAFPKRWWVHLSSASDVGLFKTRPPHCRVAGCRFLGITQRCDGGLLIKEIYREVPRPKGRKFVYQGEDERIVTGEKKKNARR